MGGEKVAFLNWIQNSSSCDLTRGKMSRLLDFFIVAKEKNAAQIDDKWLSEAKSD